MKALLAAITLTLVTTSTALAGVSFTRADRNGDGLVSAAEIVSSSLSLKKFGQADLNRDRQWTPAEFNTVRQPIVNPNTQDDD